MTDTKQIVTNWYRKVGIFTSIIHQSRNDHDGIPWAKRFWRTSYRDARQYAQIACHGNDELVKFRGFGTVKSIWAKSGNCIGRIRVDDLRGFSNNEVAAKVGLSDYAPNRILNY